MGADIKHDFETLTMELSKGNAFLKVVIPIVSLFFRLLQNEGNR